MRCRRAIVIEFYAKTFRAFLSVSNSFWFVAPDNTHNCRTKETPKRNRKRKRKRERETARELKFIPGKFTIQFAINFQCCFVVLQFSGQFEMMKESSGYEKRLK